MFGRFLPRETSFFDFFEQHAALTIEGTKEFLSLVTTGANIPAKCRRISDIEHETDTITHRCVEALHKTFITPIDRDSIHRLITKMDDVMDFVEAAAERVELYELVVMTNDVRDLADVLNRTAAQVEVPLHRLDDVGRGPARESDAEVHVVLLAEVAGLGAPVDPQLGRDGLSGMGSTRDGQCD
jgi:uncharacterized protein Yka (UPF0111/DUF47 family)